MDGSGYSLLDPVRLIAPAGDKYYADILHARARSYEEEATAWTYSRFDGLWASVGFCVLFLAARWAWNAAFSRLMRRKAR